MKKSYKLLFLLLFFLSLRAIASPQLPDLIIYKNDTIPTYNLLIEKYLIEKFNDDELAKFSFKGELIPLSCWRGYQGVYEVIDNKLYLSGMIDCGDSRYRSRWFNEESLARMKEVFGDKVINGRVLMDWFSGSINFTENFHKNNILRENLFFLIIFRNEKVLDFSNGNLIKDYNVDNYEKVKGGYNRLKKNKISDIIFKPLNKVNFKNDKDFDCSDKYVITINEKGKVSKVKMVRDEKEIDKYYNKDEYQFCIKKIENSLVNLKFDILKNRGKPISEDVYIEIDQQENGKLKNDTYIYKE
ncbi:hypothetical protein [Chryseobacterium schmidteae]|uniref:hypothetical protein n=1 Tax=Chryseobacterium schmidteae TaxID=2730404 RepID=UPI0015894BAE|nr:hypothetical protein [Chryseobacterium schmidteae]